MKIFVITAFPQLFTSTLNESIIKRALQKGLVQIDIVDLRNYTSDKHRQVDDYPYGGGPGMILKPEPFFNSVEHIKDCAKLKNPPVILLSPQGKTYNQKKARELSLHKEIIFLCGHYKGVDERVREELVTEEISIGDYILTGGEIPAMVLIDSVVRLLPGAISDPDSAKTDSFEDKIFDCPYYTRPETFRGLRVPEVLLSGHHSEIIKWRREKALEKTKQQRADLLETFEN